MRLEKVAASDERAAGSPKHPMTWTSYHSSADIDAYLEYLAATYPTLVPCFVKEIFQN
jgi:hypothetical protein